MEGDELRFHEIYKHTTVSITIIVIITYTDMSFFELVLYIWHQVTTASEGHLGGWLRESAPGIGMQPTQAHPALKSLVSLKRLGHVHFFDMCLL